MVFGAMSLALRRCIKAHSCILSSTNTNVPLSSSVLSVFPVFHRSYSDENSSNDHSDLQSSHNTIMVENGLNVHELPLVIRKLKSLSDIEQKPTSEAIKSSSDSLNYPLVQEEFMQCSHLRDVFTLLSKCTKITPNIALGAIERIYDLERNPPPIIVPVDSIHVNLAKGAILDKLLRVVTKTEDTQTILNILNTLSTFMEPYKPKFCDELLMRVLDNKLTIEQLCDFMELLIKNRSEPKYSDTIDKLWVGFLEREQDIDEINIVKVFQILSGLKSSKRTVQALLEHKLSDLWSKISVTGMQDILEVFYQEKYISLQSSTIIGTWLYANIHAVNQDAMLDIVSKLTRLGYTDDHIEKAVEKYMKLKGPKIKTYVLIVAILNYCLQFQISNEKILNACSEYFLLNAKSVPNSFLKSFIYPFGYLNFDPINSSKFWTLVESIIDVNFYKISTDDISSILLSFIYMGKYPLKLTNRLFSSEYLPKVNSQDTMKKLYLIDIALSLECNEYSGPLLPKDQWSKPVSQDPRIRNILKKTEDVFVDVAGGFDKLSMAVMVPHIYSDETYLIDVMLHSAELAGGNFTWKLKFAKNKNIALLVHLPDHYCSDNEQLVGPQKMRKRHLEILGLKVVSLNYSILSQYYTSCNTSGLKNYLIDSISKAEACTEL